MLTKLNIRASQRRDESSIGVAAVVIVALLSLLFATAISSALAPPAATDPAVASFQGGL